MGDNIKEQSGFSCCLHVKTIYHELSMPSLQLSSHNGIQFPQGRLREKYNGTVEDNMRVWDAYLFCSRGTVSFGCVKC